MGMFEEISLLGSAHPPSFQSAPKKVPFVPRKHAGHFVRAVFFPLFPSDPSLGFKSYNEAQLEDQKGRERVSCHTQSSVAPLSETASFSSSSSSSSAASSTSSVKLQCAYCGQTATKLLLCSGCKAVRYCSAEHQKDDWKKHRAQCKKAAASK